MPSPRPGRIEGGIEPCVGVAEQDAGHGAERRRDRLQHADLDA